MLGLGQLLAEARAIILGTDMGISVHAPAAGGLSHRITK